MPDYRRAWYPGGTYFFTVNLLQRQGNDLLIRHVDLLQESASVGRVECSESHRFDFPVTLVLGWYGMCIMRIIDTHPNGHGKCRP